MRIGFLIKDTEYRKALTERISEYDRDIILDVIGASDSIEQDALILTDAKPAELGTDLIEKIKDRTIFLTTGKKNSINDCNNNLHDVFKYSGVSRLLAEISDIYSLWQGMNNPKAARSKIIACCSDSDAFSRSRCSKLASQIKYIHGGSVLILPLAYINEDSADYGKDINRFARLMYRVKAGRGCDPQNISYVDSYGISRLMMPSGRNPVAYLDGDDLDKLIAVMSGIFDTVILDIATCYREENLKAIQNADNILCFETGRRRVDFSTLVQKERSDRLKIIKLDSDNDEVFATDEYIKELYGIKDGTQMQ